MMISDRGTGMRYGDAVDPGHDRGARVFVDDGGPQYAVAEMVDQPRFGHPNAKPLFLLDFDFGFCPVHRCGRQQSFEGLSWH